MSTKIITWEMDPSSWRFVAVSPHVEDLLGYPAGDWYGETFWADHIHSDDHEQAIDYCKSAVANGENHEFECRMIAADGREVRVRNFVAVEMAEGEPKLLRGFLVDITDDKQAGQAKRDTELLLEQATRIANVGHFEWDEVTDTLVSCSAEMARIFGISVDEYVAGSATLSDSLNRVHPGDRNLYAWEREKYRELNKVEYDNNIALDSEYRIVRPDGEVRHIHELAEPVFDDAGRHVRSVGTVQDITERKRLELQLQESEERLRLAIDNSTTAFYLKDEDGRYLVVNAKFCELYGGSPETVMGKTFSDLALPGQAKESDAYDQKVLTDRFGVSWELTHTSPDGEIRTILAHKFPIFGTDGEVKAVGGVDIDITERKKAESMNLRLGRIVDQSVNEVYCFDAATLMFEAVNRGAGENLGYTLEEMKGLTPVDIKPDFSLETFEEVLRPLRDGASEQLVFETRHQRKDGTTYDVEVHLQLMATEKPPVFVAIIQDITDRKRAEREIRKSRAELELRVHERTEQLQGEVEERKYIEAALRQSEKHHRDFAESSSDWFWEMGRDQKLTYVSDRFEEITGTRSDLFIGKSPEDIVVEGEDRQKWEAHLDDLRNHRPFRNFEYAQKHPDGRSFNVRVGGIPVFDEGEFRGYRGTATDITAQVEAEQRAATAEHLLADAIEGVNEGIALYDAEERFVICNGKYREVLEGMEDFLVPGTTIETMCRESFRRGIVSDWDNEEDWVTARLARFRQGGEPVVHHMRNGQWVMTMEHKTQNGSTLITRTDVSELKETQQQLEAAKNAAEDASTFKSNFLANMSHELRTPLNAILGFADILRQQSFGPVGNEKYVEYSEDIHHSGQHLLELINDILDLSAIEAGKLELYIEAVDVAEVINASVKLVASQAEAKGVQVQIRVEDNVPLLFADKRRVMQVIINLLTNAVKFTPEGGEISVAAFVGDPAELQITVSDTGSGMDTVAQERAMAKFGRANSEVARKSEGTGLGLPLCKSLMELHDGRFELLSAPDKGTIVRLRFPLKSGGGT